MCPYIRNSSNLLQNFPVSLKHVIRVLAIGDKIIVKLSSFCQEYSTTPNRNLCTSVIICTSIQVSKFPISNRVSLRFSGLTLTKIEFAKDALASTFLSSMTTTSYSFRQVVTEWTTPSSRPKNVDFTNLYDLKKVRKSDCIHALVDSFQKERLPERVPEYDGCY